MVLPRLWTIVVDGWLEPVTRTCPLGRDRLGGSDSGLLYIAPAIQVDGKPLILKPHHLSVVFATLKNARFTLSPAASDALSRLLMILV